LDHWSTFTFSGDALLPYKLELATGLIFHRDEDETLCCARPLTGDDTSGSPYILAMREILQFIRGKNALTPKFFSAISHRVLSDGQARPGVVGYALRVTLDNDVVIEIDQKTS
jgi:hypothetical protein